MIGRKKATVVQLFQEATKPRWDDTPKRKLARERNWCYYMLAGMDALTMFMVRRGWVSVPNGEGLKRAIQSARYSVDASYFDRIEEVENKEARKRRR